MSGGMLPDILASEAASRTVERWRVDDGALAVRFSGSTEERNLVCDRCGRRHWILETHSRDGHPILAVKCHGCGTKVSLALVAAH